MATQTEQATRTTGPGVKLRTAEEVSAGEVPALRMERMKYDSTFEDRFGVTRDTWHALIDAIWPTAKTLEGVILALQYCRARGLDPMKKVCHIVPIYSSQLKRYVDTIWPGIAELRTTAMRTGEYAGNEPTVYGPDVTHTFKGPVEEWEGPDGNRKKVTKNVEITLTFPEWAQRTVYRIIQGTPRPFHGERVYWMETYSALARGNDLPNERWQRAPRQMIAKCAEATSERAAFPEEYGSQQSADEVRIQDIELNEDAIDVTATSGNAPIKEPGRRSGGKPDQGPGDKGPGGDAPPATAKDPAQEKKGDGKKDDGKKAGPGAAAPAQGQAPAGNGNGGNGDPQDGLFGKGKGGNGSGDPPPSPDGKERNRPTPPTESSEGCDRVIQWRGATYYSGGASNIAIAKIESLADDYDRIAGAGMSLDVWDTWNTELKLADWFHCNEAQAKLFVEYLREAYEAAKA